MTQTVPSRTSLEANAQSEWEVDTTATYLFKQGFSRAGDAPLTFHCHAEQMDPALVVAFIEVHDRLQRDYERKRAIIGNELRLFLQESLAFRFTTKYDPRIALLVPADSIIAQRGHEFPDDNAEYARRFKAGTRFRLDNFFKSYMATAGLYVDFDIPTVSAEFQSFPLPVFGSPPRQLTSLVSLAEKLPFVAVIGGATWTDHPVMAILAGGTAAVIWCVKPSAHVFRRSMAEKLADKLGTTMKSKDEN